VEAEGRIAGGCGGDSDQRQPFIANGGEGRGGEEARKEAERRHEKGSIGDAWRRRSIDGTSRLQRHGNRRLY
jgi:hypothetical protein